MLLHISREVPEKLTEQTCKQSASHIKSLLTVVISVVLGCTSKSSCHESIAHVAHKVGFFEEATRSFVYVRQKVVFQELLRSAHMILSALLCIWTTSSNPLKGVFLGSDGRRLLDRSLQKVDHVRIGLIVNNQTLHLFVSDNSKSPQDDSNLNRLFDQRNVAINGLSELTLVLGQFDIERLGWHQRIGVHRANFSLPRVLCVGLQFEDEDDVVCHSFLSDDDFFIAAHDEVATLIVAAFARIIDDLSFVQSGKVAELGTHHHGNFTNLDLVLLVKLLLFDNDWGAIARSLALFALLDFYRHIDFSLIS